MIVNFTFIHFISPLVRLFKTIHIINGTESFKIMNEAVHYDFWNRNDRKMKDDQNICVSN